MITVQDENDNAPKFLLTQYMTSIREDLNVGESVMTGTSLKILCYYPNRPILW